MWWREARVTVARIRAMTLPGSSLERGRAGASGREGAMEEVVSGIAKSRILIIGCDGEKRENRCNGK
jgi:hypothetical protein